ncbi:MAG: methionine synthase [Bacteroidales bacterium]|nr:methionine synthase [Bacteroidales bacterium]
MKRYTFRFDYSELKINPSRILKLLDCEREDSPEFLLKSIDKVLSEASELSDVKAELAICSNIKINKESGVMTIEGIDFHPGKIIISQLWKSESVAVFACTAGSRLSDRSKKLIEEKNLLEGYVFDVVGSEIVEAGADLMQEKLKIMMAAEGMLITNRYSPGYCGWDVSEQDKLFSLIPDNYCGITLTNSALMIPLKSVSGIIGIGKKVRFNFYTCNLCDDRNCIYRRLKQNQI